MAGGRWPQNRCKGKLPLLCSELLLNCQSGIRGDRSTERTSYLKFSPEKKVSTGKQKAAASPFSKDFVFWIEERETLPYTAMG